MAVVYYTDKAIARVERVDIPAEAFAEVDIVRRLDIKEDWCLGVKDLTVESDEKLNIASGEELAVDELTIKGRMRVKGGLDVFKDLNVIGTIDVLGEVNVGV